MEDVNIIGLDLAKNVFQAHGARADGSVAFRTKISRSKVLSFFASAPKCLVAMEACGSAHHWVRQIGALGHDVRLIAPIYVKPFVKRNKNDVAEAAARPTTRFVAVKSVWYRAARRLCCSRVVGIHMTVSRKFATPWNHLNPAHSTLSEIASQ